MLFDKHKIGLNSKHKLALNPMIGKSVSKNRMLSLYNIMTLDSVITDMPEPEGKSKIQLGYDNRGNNNLVINYSGPYNGSYIPTKKNEFNYNYDKQVTEGIISYFSFDRNSWFYDSKYENIYDNSNRLIEKLEYNNDEEEWDLSQKTNYLYDDFDNLTIEYVSAVYWGGAGEQQEQITTKNEYTYNSSNQVILYTSSYFDWEDFV